MNAEGIIKEARARFMHNESKLQLLEKYKSRLTIANQGGLWNASIELISFLRTSPPEVVLLDSFDSPIKVDSIKLLTELEKTYHKTMLEWFDEYEKLKTYR